MGQTNCPSRGPKDEGNQIPNCDEALRNATNGRSGRQIRWDNDEDTNGPLKNRRGFRAMYIKERAVHRRSIREYPRRVTFWHSVCYHKPLTWIDIAAYMQAPA